MKALFIIASQGYQDNEYTVPKKILEEADIEVTTASKEAGICQGALGGTASATLSLTDINIDDYDVVIFPGGGGAAQYHDDPQAHLLVQQAVNQHKLLAAICISPVTLANAGVLTDKKATVWNLDHKHAEKLINRGAIYTGDTVTVDDQIITANGPEADAEFGQKILEILRKQQNNQPRKN